jgi:hypothetical protein
MDLPVEGGMWLRLPALTDVRDTKSGGMPDILEVPAGSGRFYTSVWVDDIALGFANEHRFAILAGKSPWPLPFPGGGGGPPPPIPQVFFGATSGGGGAPSQTFAIATGTGVHAGDFSLAVVAVAQLSGGPGPMFTADFLPTVAVDQTPLQTQYGVSWTLYILKSPHGLGAHNFGVDVGVGNTAVMAAITVMLAGNADVAFTGGPASGAQPIAPGGTISVTSSAAAVYGAAFQISSTVFGQAWAVGIVDFMGGLTLPYGGGVNGLLNFGGLVTPPLGPLVVGENSTGPALDQWSAILRSIY